MPRIDTLHKCRFGLKLLKFLSGVLTWWAIINPGNLSSIFFPFLWLYKQRHSPERKNKLNPSMSWILSPQFSSVTQWGPTLCNSMNRSTPGLPVHHQLLESTQTHVHRVGDIIQPSHPLSSPSPPPLNLSQHQGLFQWVSSSRPHYPPTFIIYSPNL